MAVATSRRLVDVLELGREPCSFSAAKVIGSDEKKPRVSNGMS